MKIRTGFVSNSSSTAFLVANISTTKKTLVDFVQEVGQDMLNDFIKEYDWYKNDERFKLETMIENAKNRGKVVFKPGEELILSFGDEEGDILGQVFDYMLRDERKSENFHWEFYEWRR